MRSDTALAQKQCELLTFDAAWRESSGANCHKEANIIKVVTSELAVAAADRGTQILGELFAASVYG
ncbi:acyl-CoA dehydrogenase family protein [Nocardia africana]